MVGRDAELSALRHALSQRPTVIVVHGDAGSGKTTLLQEARPDGSVLNGRRLRGKPFPLGPVVDALSALTTLPQELSPLCGALAHLMPEFTRWLPPSFSPTRHQVFRAIAELLTALGPVALLIDDAHRLDSETLLLLDYLATVPPPELAIVLAMRGTSPPVPHTAEICLNPLTPADVHAIAASSGFLEELFLGTHGMPLLIVEITESLVKSGRADLLTAGRAEARRGLAEAPLPLTLRARLLEEARDLPAHAAAVVNAAAVLGEQSSYQAVRQVTGLSAAKTINGIGQAVSRQLLTGDLGFATPVLARAVYESIMPWERRILHRRASRQDHLPHMEMARHARLAEDDAAWQRYAELAADDAVSQGDCATAVELLLEVLSGAGLPAAGRERLARKLASAAIDGLSHHDTVTVLGDILAASEALPPLVGGEIRLHRGLLLVNQVGRIAAGRHEIALALPDLAESPGLLARALAALAVPMWAPETIAQHQSWMEQAVRAAQRSEDRPLQTAVHVNRVTTLLNIGDPEGRPALAALPATGSTQAETAHLARGACSHASAAGWLGHYRLADELIERAERLARDASAEFASSITEATRLRLDWCCGRWDGLLTRAEKVAIDSAGVPPVAAEARLVLGLLHLAQGELGPAFDELNASARVSDPDAAIPVAVAAAGGLAEVLLAREENPAGLLAEAVELVRRKGNWVWLSDIAPLVAGEALLSELAAGLDGRDSPLGEAALVACTARLLEAEGDHRRAATHHARAARLYATLPQPYAVAQELAAAGRCRLLLGGGPELLTRALARLERLGAAREAGRARMFLREHGVTVTHKRGRRGYGDRLSPRETEVARLAAAGVTNREIATALFLSERTVEDHVARAMRKSCVNSRHELKGA